MSSYLQGKIDGMKLAKELILRRDVSPVSIQWLSRTITDLEKELEESERAVIYARVSTEHQSEDLWNSKYVSARNIASIETTR